MSDLEIGTHRKLYCNNCKRETHHKLKASHLRQYREVNGEPPDDYLVFWEDFEYRFWICCGCDTATLEEAYTNIGMIVPPHGDQTWTSVLYPKRMTGYLPQKRFRQLDKKLGAIYREVIESFNSDLRILCAMGLRALLEGICADKEVSGEDLYHKIDGLKTHLPSNIVESLHSFRFMGNVAAHKLQAPQRPELQLAIEVMEDLLNFLYELEYKARRLPKGPTPNEGA